MERRYTILKAAENDTGLQQWLIDKCKADPWFFVSTFLYINRPDLLVQGYSAGIAPYLNWEFHKEALEIFLGLNGWRNSTNELYKMAIYKSRATGGSVVILAGMLWLFLFQRNTTQYIISLKEKAVDNGTLSFDSSLFGKLRFFIVNLPKWLKPSPWLESDQPRKCDRKMILVNPDNNNTIVGSSTTPNAERGSRGFRALIDEANQIPYLDDLLGSMSLVAPWVLVSSVEGSSTTFAKYCNGEIAPIVRQKGEPGIVVRKFHYSQKPEFNPGTKLGRDRIANMKAGDIPEKWASEMECDFSANKLSGPKIFKMPDLLSDADYGKFFGKECHIFGAFDFGQSFALSAIAIAKYYPKDDVLIFVDSITWAAEDVHEIKQAIIDSGWNIAKFYGDAYTNAGPKTLNGIKVENRRNWIENLASVGISVEKVGAKNAIATINSFQKAMDEKKILFAPSSKRTKNKYPSLYDALKQYEWNLPPNTTAETISKEAAKPKKNGVSHPSDAAQLLMAAIWKQTTVRNVKLAG